MHVSPTARLAPPLAVRQLQNSRAGLEGTIEYCAPEVLRGEPFTEKCDGEALACVRDRVRVHVCVRACLRVCVCVCV